MQNKHSTKMMFPLLPDRPHLDLPADLPFADWRALGEGLARADIALQWAIGDWWAFAEKHYGVCKGVVEGEGWQGPSFQTCMDCGAVAKAFETSRRHEVLTFNHHREVAALAPADADALLARAEHEELSTRQLREAARVYPRPPKAKTNGAAPERRVESVSLAEWKELSPDQRREFLQPHNFPGDARFNKQTTTGIEWAQWSWNPVTGCLHDCPYCYARDIAERLTDAFPHGFAPAFWPDRLNAPARMNVPEEAEADARYLNVFTCSMADLFGRWVPREWIEAVLDTVRANPQWNFLFLTKFPKRMAEFDIPENAWMGTTVDLQKRVANAETAFGKVNAGVRWLSVEPMLEPLKFSRLDLFQWLAIGGASGSSQTPEFKPPFRWIADLVAQADAAGVEVYFKTNLLGSRILGLPFAAPIKRGEDEPIETPEELRYLGKDISLLKRSRGRAGAHDG